MAVIEHVDNPDFPRGTKCVSNTGAHVTRGGRLVVKDTGLSSLKPEFNSPSPYKEVAWVVK